MFKVDATKRQVSAEVSQRILEIMPHRPPMRFIDQVDRLSESEIECSLTLNEDHRMISSGKITSLCIVEFFAQAAAALIASKALNDPNANMAGALLGARKLDFLCDALAIGDEISIHATDDWGAGQLRQLQCVAFRDGEKIASGAVNVVAFG